jgi:hypothetical protein
MAGLIDKYYDMEGSAPIGVLFTLGMASCIMIIITMSIFLICEFVLVRFEFSLLSKIYNKGVK